MSNKILHFMRIFVCLSHNTEKYFECNTACVTMYKRRKWMWQRPYQCDCIYLYIESGSMPLLFLLVLSILGISINLDLKSFICYLIQFITLLFSMELNGKEGVERKKKHTHTHSIICAHDVSAIFSWDWGGKRSSNQQPKISEQKHFQYNRLNGEKAL